MLSGQEFIRYSRQLMLEEVGEAGQERLQGSTVLIVGLGGLGAPAALYLAAAGVGHLILADHDRVEASNLQRQILYGSDDIGSLKAEQAHNRLRDLNPHIRLSTVSEEMHSGNLAHWVSRSDLVLDCSDNLPTRQAINAACVADRKPLISAAALRWDGSLSLFDSRRADSPCHACLVPPDSEAAIANCASSGVMGPVLGVMGSLQALVALQALASGTLPGCGTVRHFDGKRLQWLTTTIARKPDCPVCGESN